MDVWSAAPVCFDFLKDELILGTDAHGGLVINRSSKPPLPFAWDRTGPSPRLMVYLVKRGSPMDLAGFHAGDEIIRVGKLEAGVLTRRVIRSIAYGRETQPWIVLRKGGEVRISFPLSPGSLAE